MVEEQLAPHEEEGEIVERPAENGAANLVIEALEEHVLVIAATALPAEDGDTFEEDVDNDSESRSIPNDRVAHEVDLAVIAAPEVDTTAEDGPRLGAGVPGMGVRETSISPPHYLVELDELAKETGPVVVDFLGILAEQGVLVALNIPERVGESATTGTGDFLLLRGPLGKLDLVREEHATRHNVNELELSLDGADALLSQGTSGLGLDDLDTEVVVSISFKALISVGRNLVLPVGLGNGRTDIVRMKTTMGVGVIETKDRTVLDKKGGLEVVPGTCTVDGLTVHVKGLRLVLQQPIVIVVLVGVEGDLLLLAARGIHQGVGVEVTTLGVDVAQSDAATKVNVRGNIVHTLRVERRLKLGTHETVTIAGVSEDLEVDGEHGHVKRKRDDDKTEGTGEEVLEPKADSDGFGIAEKEPELE